MDKNTLNNQIVLCRSTVKKVRVFVIRKILKKMKILQSCKNEVLKEKKIKKAEKLYSMIQIIKKLKSDDIIKFALINENYDVFLKNSSKNMKTAAMAILAKHVIINKAISDIRKHIPNWKFDLPFLLMKKKSKSSKILHKKCQKYKYHDLKNEKSNKENNEGSKHINNLNKLNVKSEDKYSTKKFITSRKSYLLKAQKLNYSELKKGSIKGLNEDKKKVVKKIDDPFFIEKKIRVPKLIKYNSSDNESKKEELDHRFLNKNYKNSYKSSKSIFKANNCVSSNQSCNSYNNDDKALHPSWVAKKVNIIKPFEGKKIKFSDDEI